MAFLKQNLGMIARVIATLVVVTIAGIAAWFAWQYYVYSPWTRDAVVQADVINIAPNVSGTVQEVAVSDDNRVAKGELLFRIDPVRFKNAVAARKAALAQAKAQAAYDQRNAERLRSLPSGAVSTQKVQQASSKAQASLASVRSARAKLAQARQNLQWSAVTSPVNGYVTHLLLDEGDYVNAGTEAITLVDTQTYRVLAYFEETKLPKIEVGDPVKIDLMARNRALQGHVASITHGIAVANYASGERNLPDVNPTFQWVRLAQRVPVTITFDHLSDALPLAIGMTATVRVHPDAADQSSGGSGGA